MEIKYNQQGPQGQKGGGVQGHLSITPYQAKITYVTMLETPNLGTDVTKFGPVRKKRQERTVMPRLALNGYHGLKCP